MEHKDKSTLSPDEHLKLLDKEREDFLNALTEVDVEDIDEDTVQKWMRILIQREECLSALFTKRERDELQSKMLLLRRLLSDVLSLSRISISDELKLVLRSSFAEISRFCVSEVDDACSGGDRDHAPCCSCCYMRSDWRAAATAVPSSSPHTQHAHPPLDCMSECSVVTAGGGGSECSSVAGGTGRHSARRRRDRGGKASEFLTVAVLAAGRSGAVPPPQPPRVAPANVTATRPDSDSGDDPSDNNSLEDSTNLGVDD